MLKVEPIKKYRFPGFPDKRIVLENPDILKTLPERWKGKVYAGLALSSIVVLLLSGCQRPVATAGTMPAPVSLTEEEACNIIINEAAKYGVKFDNTGLELKDVEFYMDNNTSGISTTIKHKLDIHIDGYDKEKNIGFEFASRDEAYSFAENLGGLSDNEIRSFNEIDYIEDVKEALEYRKEKMNFEGFYSNESQNIEDCEMNLREQVKTFMEWLKTQGVI